MSASLLAVSDGGKACCSCDCSEMGREVGGVGEANEIEISGIGSTGEEGSSEVADEGCRLPEGVYASVLEDGRMDEGAEVVVEVEVFKSGIGRGRICLVSLLSMVASD